jgi:hypothetical protein
MEKKKLCSLSQLDEKDSLRPRIHTNPKWRREDKCASEQSWEMEGKNKGRRKEYSCRSQECQEAGGCKERKTTWGAGMPPPRKRQY